MIKYSLICVNDHTFEGWFSNGDDYNTQSQSGLLSCPVCETVSIQKSLMAPSLSTTKTDSDKSPGDVSLASNTNVPAKYAEAMSQMRKLRSQVMANAHDVGKEFPEEARKIHYGETEKRGIYGQASIKDVEGLVDEGIDIVPLPVLPEDKN